ncbi:MAG: hypothetical protein QXU32_02630 [Nitrososphaerales archaeon]
MYNIEILIGIVMMVASSVPVSADEATNLIGASADLALKSINDAHHAGADVSVLVTSFNVGLDLMEQAEQSTFISCSSFEECNEQAARIFVKTTSDAHSLREQAQAMSNFKRLVTFGIYTPVAAFASSFISYYLWRTWKANEVKRFMDMEIRVKNE